MPFKVHSHCTQDNVQLSNVPRKFNPENFCYTNIANLKCNNKQILKITFRDCSANPNNESGFEMTRYGPKGNVETIQTDNTVTYKAIYKVDDQLYRIACETRYNPNLEENTVRFYLD